MKADAAGDGHVNPFVWQGEKIWFLVALIPGSHWTPTPVSASFR